MKISIYSILILLLLTSCSTPKEIAPLSEELTFSDDGAESFGDVDFGEEMSASAEFEVEGLEGESEEDSVDFEAFDSEEQAEVSKNEALSDDFDVFDSEEESVVQAPVPVLEEEPEDDFDISFESPLEVEPEAEPELVFSAASKPAKKMSKANGEVLSIDYNASHAGGAFMIKTSNNADYSTEFIPETNQYVVKLKNTKIGKSLSRPFLTKDFRQSFEAMNSYRGEDSSVRLVFQLKKNSYPKVSLLGGRLIVEPGLSAATTVKQNKLSSEDENAVSLSASSFEDFLLDTSEFVGEPVSIQVKDESIVTVIQFIAEQVGANIVLSSSVQGKISIKLKDVPWDQALVTIMKTTGLGYVRTGNILRVATLEELRKESVAATEIQNARKTLAPFHVKVFPLSYASPTVLAEKVTPFLTAATGPNTRTGQVISEVRSSSLIVRDTFEVIQSIAALVKELDRAPLQVMINAKIVEATKSFTKDFRGGGVNVGFNSETTGGTLTGRANAIYQLQENGAPSFIPDIRIGGIDFFGSLSASLRLQEIDSKVKILSSPSVLVINNEAAKIEQTDEVLNQVQTVVNNVTTTSTERSPVRLSLEVTPQVSADSNIIMDINVVRQFPDTQSTGNAVSSREAKTKVIIGNNKTAMIGGIYQVVDRKSISGAPVLRKIPLLGWLFRSDLKAKNDTELVIFITPRVMNKGAVGDSLADQPLAPSQGDKVSKF